MDMTRFGTQAQKDADGNVGKFKECIETAIMRDVLTVPKKYEGVHDWSYAFTHVALKSQNEAVIEVKAIEEKVGVPATHFSVNVDAGTSAHVASAGTFGGRQRGIRGGRAAQQVVRWCCGLHCIGLAQVVHGDDGEPAAPLSCGLQPRVSAADESGALPPGGYVASITPPTEEFSGGVELLPVVRAFARPHSLGIRSIEPQEESDCLDGGPAAVIDEPSRGSAAALGCGILPFGLRAHFIMLACLLSFSALYGRQLGTAVP
ncbi:hypothetical protein CYMTET_6412 [Cymbomonas tetramitiformis]|uniref:Uncharacterized protein n=1 Tax=Cymbomonas tetramitiformis TaxID=36881 RepID=A0AAE0GXB1_9CHLO|nr:hypothetical protein CYMTET_6412 [Cymbomonas tetramitiformis]